MGIRIHKPITAGRRKSSVQTFDDITKFEPEKSLAVIRKRTGGRNAQGKITVRHRGGGAKRYIRLVDFVRCRYNVPAKVTAIEYDPSRGARLALLVYSDQTKYYMIAPLGLNIGDEIVASREAVEIKIGNRLPLQFIPIGLMVHNIEFIPGSGGKLVRGAGTGAQLMVVEGRYAHLRLPSGEIRMVPKECAATIGQVGNPDWRHIRWGKAGRVRHRGWRPTVRGKAMNPVDHPHGGGEGHNPIGLKHPKTPWGKPAIGVKTRRRRASARLILQSRKRGR
ncbi:50S ribosomal protein L2 [Candidatus Uhrbacteria bacterium RIFCSPLOWO2_12_FULL_46_10]|uniref:Large ribosomal subunit protein uL2 n=1 Tax=Candidatus Uhrbacteria bacterium RIFCSPLOWO2_01_FULL_47_25 TaxID=1802402 RepID=A0A1F7UYF6_9BACT|nr:MAG: 50S ribosomal protein L2 [Parcubacteria group bacterium GW2011_GWA2_46_9]OGL59139.1 MAG: 50S ribosomal protein L2 [Candidatus Uhrbacteria bacterium RIFCSPHIGHO2_01_FULL_46_23]OGL70267.1 MAG: 50S ribosomal protein L2 [Candidatus Uhrbacteria bacterium RIFCSPHIGHO2_02_FULL_47_29]OGL74688.1 MAG: 50S ribosomal protein L2 [Candidatus Uhrbacteria bacterium RIFCSPHIGHO2_12_FULL_46_13]OGL82804.1 MAG: 50S ribosomal protein L2 [Candidatus Uhrbacteria bacterium RIFCSPLOWO2_01_FULL_47_25]OGL83898.1